MLEIANALTCYLDLEVVFKQPLEVLECLRSIGSGRHISWNGFKPLTSLSPALILTTGEVILSRGREGSGLILRDK